MRQRSQPSDSSCDYGLIVSVCAGETVIVPLKVPGFGQTPAPEASGSTALSKVQVPDAKFQVPDRSPAYRHPGKPSILAENSSALIVNRTDVTVSPSDA